MSYEIPQQLEYREKVVFWQEQMTELSKDILAKLLQRPEVMRMIAEEMKNLK